MLGPTPTASPPPTGRPSSHARYAAALLITVVAILSQYFVPELVPALLPVYGGLVTGLLIIYGIPVAAFALLVGTGPIRRWSANLQSSALPALGWYGVLSVVAFGVTVVLVIIYEVVDPSALNLLSRPNPVVVAARSNPWFWVAFSFVIGAVEELIFRGWVFGYWLQKGSGSYWVPAIWTSALFASLHLYYGTTYLAASPLVYPDLFLLGLAFSLAVRGSRGNLVWVALLHGANDATAFLQIVNGPVAIGLHYGIIVVGAIVAVVLYASRHPTPPRMAPTPWAGAPSYGWAPPPPPMAIPVAPPPGGWTPAPPPPWPSPPPPPPPSSRGPPSDRR